MSEKNIEYLAGYFDGDGSISITRNYDCLYHNDMPTTRLKVNISSAMKEDLVRYCEEFNIDKSRLSQTDSNLSDNKQYRLDVSGNKAEKILNALKSYLGEKEEMAQLALNYRELKPGPGEVSGKTPTDTIEDLNNMAEEMSEMNQR